jgi:DNA-binding CsgD family transcriptional regulator
MGYIKWTTKETDELKIYLSQGLSKKEISQMMNIDISRIHSKINTFKEDIQKRKNINQLNSQSMTGIKKTGMWSTNEYKILIESLNEGKNKYEISEILGRTVNSVYHIIKFINNSSKFVRFGLEWSKEEIAELSCDKLNIQEFCNTYGRSVMEVTQYFNNQKVLKPAKCLRNIIDPVKKVYDIVPCKHFVQDELYNYLNNANLSLLTLLGPTPERYIKMLLNKNILGDNFLYSNEINIAAFNKVANALDKIKFDKINLTWGDISAAYPQNIIDLDLMGKWDTQAELVKKMFNKQKLLNGKKHFMFNLSARGIANSNIPSYISKILNELTDINISVTSQRNVFFKHNKKKLYVVKYFAPNSNFKIHIYRYFDTSPMINILLSYE